MKQEQTPPTPWAEIINMEVPFGREKKSVSVRIHEHPLFENVFFASALPHEVVFENNTVLPAQPEVAKIMCASMAYKTVLYDEAHPSEEKVLPGSQLSRVRPSYYFTSSVYAFTSEMRYRFIKIREAQLNSIDVDLKSPISPTLCTYKYGLLFILSSTIGAEAAWALSTEILAPVTTSETSRLPGPERRSYISMFSIGTSHEKTVTNVFGQRVFPSDSVGQKRRFIEER